MRLCVEEGCKQKPERSSDRCWSHQRDKRLEGWFDEPPVIGRRNFSDGWERIFGKGREQ